MNKIILSLAIATILGGGSMLASSTVYADSNNEKSNNGNSDSGHSNNGNSDSDYRGKNDEPKKISICHVPPGNPNNKHTIHIGFSAWPAHRDNHGGDYLGSCNNPPSTSASPSSSSSEETIVIKDCKGEYRKTLVELTQSYFDPIIVNDDALDDEATVVALSECLDRGDSSDSGKSDSGKKKSDSSKGKPDKGKGGGHDSVSDSGKHHRISSCKDQDSSDSHHKSGDSKESDSSKNYRKKLQEKIDSYNAINSHGDSSLNISDSSMDDSGVLEEYKKCADSNKLKGDSDKGDSGHKYRIMNNCSNAKDIKEKVKTYKEKVKNEAKYEKRPIVIKSSSMSDKRIEAAVNACIDPDKGDAEKLVIPPTKPGVSGSQGFKGRLNWREKSQ